MLMSVIATMKLYRLGTIDEKEIEKELVDLQGRKGELEASQEEAKALEESLMIRDEDIEEVVRNLKKELNYADPKIRKRVTQTLLGETKIHPKEGNSWDRILEVSGAYIPLTRLKMASPTGFEPVLPT